MSELGEAYGEWIRKFVSSSLMSCLNQTFMPFMLGELIYRWIKSMSTDCETKIEYDFMYGQLIEFLKKPQTISDLGHECVNAVHLLQT